MPRRRFLKSKRHGYVTKYGTKRYVKSKGYAKGFGKNIKMSIKPTVKKNARQITKLWKNANDGKYVLRTIDNSFIATNAGWTSILLNDIAHYDPATPGYRCREEDATQVRLRNIRIRFTVHCNADTGARLQKVYVALMKTYNAIGDSGTTPTPPGIQMPDPDLMFDPVSIGAGSLLAPWEGFALTQGAGSETMKTTTILKRWTCYIEPQGGYVSQNLTTANIGAGTGSIVDTPGSNTLNLNYTSTRPSARYFTHTHPCLQAKVKFENKTSDEPINIKYYLVALAANGNTHEGYFLNASCKINFYDN